MNVNKSIRLRAQGHIKGSIMQDKTAIDSHKTKDAFQPLTNYAVLDENKQTLPSSTLGSDRGLS